MFALTIATMGIMAMIAVTFGQAVVRRQQAQMVVDAAAFAGAAEQAKGLNTIARINEKELHVIDALIITQASGALQGYHDNYDTTMQRITCCGWGPDWGMDNWYDYRSDVFDTLNKAAVAVNYAYGVAGKPYRAARKIVSDNFGTAGDSIFSGEAPVSHGPVVWPPDAGYATTLVNLTPPTDYAVGGLRRYTGDSGALNEFCSPCAALLVGAGACFSACQKYEDVRYLAVNAYFNGVTAATGDNPRYPMGNFYANDTEHDVRFSYYLRVPGASPLYGKDFFKTTPDIVVVATAKPYGGYLGAPFEEKIPGNRMVHFGYWQQDGREIQYTYKAKLRPVTLNEKLTLAGLIEGTDAITDPSTLNRYFSIRH